MELFSAVRDVENNKRYADATQELTCLRTGSFLDMGFAGDLEQQYREGQKEWYRDAIRISSLLAALLLSASYVVEWLTGLHPSPVTLSIRGVVVAALLGTYFYAGRSKRLTWKYWVVAANTIMVSATLLLIAQEISQPIKLMYYCNVFLVEIVVFTFIRLPLNFTNTLGLVLLLMVGGAVYLDNMNYEISAHIVFFMFSSTVVSVMVSIKTEKMSRESFLKSQLLEHEKNQLRVLNERINEDASQDRVTRLLNRVAFEDKLLTHWSFCSQNEKWLVMVAIHIEHFAFFNEQRGTELGDDLLREVARKIRVVLIDKEDAASRISGGRFVVMLTGSEAVVNGQLERLRENLSSLTVLQRAAVVPDTIYLSWGRVLLEPDSDRDPRGLLDRMFRHLVALERHALCCRQEAGQQSLGGS